MKNFALSLILVIFSAVTGSIILVSWLDTVESIETNVYRNYLAVPEVEASSLADEELKQQLIEDIQARLALLDEDTVVEEVSVDILPKNPDQPIVVDASEIPVEPSTTVVSSGLVLQSVPFTSQAPFGDWSQPWQDACEEASVIMAHAHFSNIPLSAAYVRDEVYKLIEYEEDALGYYYDTNVADTALFARTQYGLTTKIIDNATSDSIKAELDQGHLVIAPMAGRLLANPYFTPPGPLYHMLVITGYDESKGQFITNDPGTRNGAALRYSYDNIMHALHDWTGDKNTITSGAKRVLVIEGKVE